MNNFMLCSKDTVTDAPVVVRKQAEGVAPEKKPTAIRKGYWRNRWTSTIGRTPFNGPWKDQHLQTDLRDGTWLGALFHRCPQAAEQSAQRDMQKPQNAGLEYLGPVFFPAEGDKP